MLICTYMKEGIYMKFEELVKTRQSCRKYSSKKVEQQKVEIMLDSALLAPSACNSQPWHFIVVNDESVISKMPSLLQVGKINKFTDQVNTFIIICETKAHLILSAKSQGLSTCIMGAFKDAEMKELFNIPDDTKIKIVLAVGYAEDETIIKKVRKSKDNTVSYNKF